MLQRHLLLGGHSSWLEWLAQDQRTCFFPFHEVSLHRNTARYRDHIWERYSEPDRIRGITGVVECQVIHGWRELPAELFFNAWVVWSQVTPTWPAWSPDRETWNAFESAIAYVQRRTMAWVPHPNPVYGPHPIWYERGIPMRARDAECYANFAGLCDDAAQAAEMPLQQGRELINVSERRADAAVGAPLGDLAMVTVTDILMVRTLAVGKRMFTERSVAEMQQLIVGASLNGKYSVMPYTAESQRKDSTREKDDYLSVTVVTRTK